MEISTEWYFYGVADDGHGAVGDAGGGSASGSGTE